MSKKNAQIKRMVGTGILTAIVIVLQAMASGIKFGPFAINLVLVPIVVGSALYGAVTGAWLGLVFGIVVLLTDAGVFLGISIGGTIATVIVKGVCAGLLAGCAYKLLKNKNRLLAVVFSAIVCAVTNTGIFLVGCRLFFFETIKAWSVGYENAFAYMILGLVGVNFLVELAINIVLSSVIVRILNVIDK